MDMTRQAMRGWRLAMTVVVMLVTGCAGVYLDPGPNPALVRVRLDLTADLTRIPPGAADVSHTPRWDWGLYLVGRDGRLLPLRPQTGEALKLVEGHRLTRDTVFLVPAGRQRVRLLAEGYVHVRYGMTAEPVNLTTVQQDFDLDLAPGGEVAISPGGAGR